MNVGKEAHKLYNSFPGVMLQNEHIFVPVQFEKDGEIIVDIFEDREKMLNPEEGIHSTLYYEIENDAIDDVYFYYADIALDMKLIALKID